MSLAAKATVSVLSEQELVFSATVHATVVAAPFLLTTNTVFLLTLAVK